MKAVRCPANKVAVRPFQYSQLSLDLVKIVVLSRKLDFIYDLLKIWCTEGCGVPKAVWALNFQQPIATTATTDKAIRGSTKMGISWVDMEASCFHFKMGVLFLTDFFVLAAFLWYPYDLYPTKDLHF